MFRLIFFLCLFYLVNARKATAVEQELIVRRHNEIRSNKYSNKLADLADGWVKKCSTKHPSGKAYKNTGTNLATIDGVKNVDFMAALEQWYAESKYYINNRCKSGKNCNHYKQVIWAKSHSVGCAVMDCSSKFPKSPQPVYLYACVYQPEGNGLLKKPYKTGEVCKDCPAGSTCKNNLCSFDAFTTPVPTSKPSVLPINKLILPSKTESPQMTAFYNGLRAQVFPKASNMLRVKYSTVLANQAGKIAETCSINSITVNKFPMLNKYGMTLAEVDHKSLTFQPVLQKWWSESSSYFYDYNQCVNDRYQTKCHNYKQMAWHSVREYGCAAAVCGRSHKIAGALKYLVVCLYDSKADIHRQPYLKGQPGTQCPLGYKFDGYLCTKVYPNY